MSRSNKWYGWVPDLPDQRDLVYAAPMGVLRKLPVKVDLRGKCPAVYNQGELGSCTANAIGAAHQFSQVLQREEEVGGRRLDCSVRDGSVVGKSAVFVPSRLFIYFNERVIAGTVDEDSGAMLRDGIKTVAKQGVCPEAEWPYVVARYRTKPSQACYRHALDHQALTYHSVRRVMGQMKGCLASGFPFVFGLSVYESFESAAVAKTGKMLMPKPREKMLGGHAVMAVGYDDAKKAFIVRNSWGDKWGIKGYFMMPYEYLLEENLSADFWTIRLVEE